MLQTTPASNDAVVLPLHFQSIVEEAHVMVSEVILAHAFHEMKDLGWVFYCFNFLHLPRS